MYSITTNKEKKAAFYILSKGNNAGKPVKESTPNCFAVSTNENLLNGDYFFYIVLNAFNQGKFKNSIKGSVIPFLRIADLKQSINKII